MSPRRIRGSRSWQRAVRCPIYNFNLLLFWSSSKRGWMIWSKKIEESQDQSETRSSNPKPEVQIFLCLPSQRKLTEDSSSSNQHWNLQDYTKIQFHTLAHLHCCTQPTPPPPALLMGDRQRMLAYSINRESSVFRQRIKHRTNLFLHRWYSWYRKTPVTSWFLFPFIYEWLQKTC